jgi:hypothetical protein
MYYRRAMVVAPQVEKQNDNHRRQQTSGTDLKSSGLGKQAAMDGELCYGNHG